MFAWQMISAIVSVFTQPLTENVMSRGGSSIVQV